MHLAIRAIPNHLNEFKYSSWILQWGRGEWYQALPFIAGLGVSLGPSRALWFPYNTQQTHEAPSHPAPATHALAYYTTPKA